MRYTVLLDPIQEPGFEGFYYAHIPTLDLTTHGQGVEGALAAACELVEVWIAEQQANGETVLTATIVAMFKQSKQDGEEPCKEKRKQ